MGSGLVASRSPGKGDVVGRGYGDKAWLRGSLWKPRQVQTTGPRGPPPSPPTLPGYVGKPPSRGTDSCIRPLGTAVIVVLVSHLLSTSFHTLFLTFSPSLEPVFGGRFNLHSLSFLVPSLHTRAGISFFLLSSYFLLYHHPASSTPLLLVYIRTRETKKTLRGQKQNSTRNSKHGRATQPPSRLARPRAARGRHARRAL